MTKTLNGVVENDTYNTGDKMLTAGNKSYSYDAAGRTIRVTSPSGITNLAYDEESRLTSVTGAGGNHSYTYNGLNTRMSKTANGMTTQFHRDGAYVTDPVIWDSGATYTPGISERRSNATRYLHSGLKNATAQSDASQAIAATRQYDAFGMVTNQTGNWSGPFGYAGGFGYQEDETGLRLLGHRYYDPSTGRFLTRDPIKDGRNWYSYCDNNPINGSDPSGLRDITKQELADIQKLYDRKNWSGTTQPSLKEINEAVNAIKAAIAASNGSDPAGLKLVLQALRMLGNNDYGKAGSAGGRKDQNKCNLFVKDAIEIALGSGKAPTRSFGRGEWSANNWASDEDNVHWRVENGKPQLGDIAAYDGGSGSGHVGIYVPGILLNANASGVRAASYGKFSSHGGIRFHRFRP